MQLQLQTHTKGSPAVHSEAVVVPLLFACKPSVALLPAPATACRASSTGVLTIPASELTRLTLKYDTMPGGGSTVASEASTSTPHAAAGQAASTALLADVSTLLADVSDLQQHLSDGGRASAGAGAADMDDGLLLDDGEAAQAPSGSSAAAAGAGAAAGGGPGKGGQAVDEVVTEEVYEYCVSGCMAAVD